uniref:Uncharacterized protein n=1 Tax=Oryctolagus cuniculus TaxID=9986 RepID=A0A5F9DNL3_RABIT
GKGVLELKGIPKRGVTKRKKKKDQNTAKLLKATGASQKNEAAKRRYLDKRLPGQIAEDAGGAAKGTDPEASVQNPQAESGGLPHTPGHTHRASPHPQSQLDEVAHGLCEEQGPAAFGLWPLHHPLTCSLASSTEAVGLKAACPSPGTRLKRDRPLT